MKDFFNKEHEKPFELLEGTGKVMVSAPHSVPQTRNGRIKCAEPETGVLAYMLHESLDCPVIFKTKNCGDDANYDERSDYKDALVEYIAKHGVEFLIDLHLLSSERKVGVDLGTAENENIDGKEYLKAFLEEFSDSEFDPVLIDYPFAAKNPFTVSSYIRKNCGIQCMQIEINSRLVYGASSREVFKKTFTALKNCILKLNALLGTDG